MEKAYKKDKASVAIGGIECICFAFHTLSIMHITQLYKYDFKIYVLVSSYIISIYYVLKSIIIYTKGIKKYLDTFSDVSEIVKKEEPLKKEAKRRIKEEIKLEETKKEIEKEKKEIKKTNQKKKAKTINKTIKTISGEEKLEKEKVVEKKPKKRKIKEEVKGND